MVKSHVNTVAVPVTVYKAEQEFVLTLTANEVNTLCRALRGSLNYFWTRSQSDLLTAMLDLQEGIVSESLDLTTHDGLVTFALGSAEVMAEAQKAKIYGIKALRAAAKCGLKEAKEAIEDSRVRDRIALDALRAKLTGE